MKTSPRIAAAMAAALLLALVPMGISRILQQPDALIYLPSMEGIGDRAEVVWKDRKVGSISGRTMDRGVHRLELTLDPALFKSVHADVEVRIDRNSGFLLLVGGDRKTEPLLEKGVELTLERGTLLKGVSAARQGFEEAVEKIAAFWEGWCGPAKKRPILAEDNTQTRIVQRGKIENQEGDFFVVGSLDGIEVGSSVEWNGARIGKVSQVGYYQRWQKADVVLENGYFGKLRSDARVQIVQLEPPVIRVIGGDDASQKIVEPGGRIPLQSISDKSRLAGANLRSLFRGVTGEFHDLWRSIADKQFLRETEERERIASRTCDGSTY